MKADAWSGTLPALSSRHRYMNRIWNDVRKIVKLKGAGMRDNSTRSTQRQPRRHHMFELVGGEMPQSIQAAAYRYITAVRSSMVAESGAIYANLYRLSGGEVATLRLGKPIELVSRRVRHMRDYIAQTSDTTLER